MDYQEEVDSNEFNQDQIDYDNNGEYPDHDQDANIAFSQDNQSMRDQSSTKSDSNSILCPRHQHPIRGVCLDGRSPHKSVCEMCFREIHRDILVNYLDLQDFLSKGKKFEFTDAIPGFEKEAQKKQKLLKDFLGSIDMTFQHFIDQLAIVKERFKENMRKRFEYENDALLRIVNGNTRMKSQIEKLRKQLNYESLTQSVNDYIEVAKLIPIQTKLDGNKFTHFASEKIKACSLQLDLSKNLLEKVVLVDDLHYSSPSPLRASMKANSDLILTLSSPRSPAKNSPMLLKSPKFSLHEANKAFIDSFPVAPLRGERGEKTLKPRSIGPKEKPKNLRESLVSSFESIETRLKSIDSIQYLPEHGMLVLGGSLKGDQPHKLLFMKLAPEITPFRMINAHSSQITNIVAGKNVLLTSSKDKLIKAWDLVTFENIFGLRHNTQVFGMVFDEEEGRIYSFGEFLDIRVWDFATRKELKSLQVPSERLAQLTMVTLGKDPQKKYLAAACKSSDKIYIVDVEKNRIVLKINEHIPIGNCDLKFVKDHNLLVNTSIGGHVRHWSLSKAEPNLIAEPVNFNLDNTIFPIVNMAVGDQDGLVLLANNTREIMVTSFKEVDMKAVIKFDEEEQVQHSRLLYLSDQKLLYTIDKFSGSISVISINGSGTFGGDSVVSITPRGENTTQTFSP